jgi:biotin transport system substrate-specific component
VTIITQTQPTLIDILWPARESASARSALLVVLGSLFLAVCAQIYVPLEPVPITMQTFGVLVLGMAYGWRLGMASVGLYLVEGAAGLPVFAGFAGGLPVLFGPTGGYLLGFVLAAGLVGWLAERNWDRNPITTALAMLLGNIAIYVPGLLVLALFVGAENVIEFGLWPFLLGDAFKLALAAGLMPVAWYLLRRR